mgnify:CR=1 FL=1
MTRWEEATVPPSGAPRREYLDGLVNNSGFLAAMQRQAPELMAELRGIADGAGLDFDLVAAYNLMDEQWAYDRERVGSLGCSLLLRRADKEHSGFLAQNMDLPDFMDGGQLVLRVAGADQPESLVFTSAGLLGLTGVNRCGVAVCVNTLLMLPSSSTGLPVSAIVRGALAQPNLASAERFIERSVHASGQHYAIASPEGFASLECSAAGVAQSKSDGAMTLIHTNHPLVVEPDRYPGWDARNDESLLANSRRRLTFLEARASGNCDLATAEDLLEDRTVPICMGLDDGLPGTTTFGSVAYKLSDPPEARFRFGNSDSAGWLPFHWRETT